MLRVTDVSSYQGEGGREGGKEGGREREREGGREGGREDPIERIKGHNLNRIINAPNAIEFMGCFL